MAVVRAAFEHLRVNPNKFKPLPSRVKVRALFRKICREAPRIVTIYELPHSAADVRRVVKLLFVQVNATTTVLSASCVRACVPAAAAV